MAFSIKFLDEPLVYPFVDPKTPAAPGLLVMGDSRERFCSSLHQWSKEQYENQWRQAISSLLGGGAKVALIVEYLSRDIASKLEWWPMYKQGEIVYLQNQLFFYDQVPKPFSLDTPFESLRDGAVVNEEGHRISEWRVSLSEIEQFARTFRGQRT